MTASSKATPNPTGTLESPWSTLLRDVAARPRLLDRDGAHHPETIRRVLAALDVAGPSEAGDCIHSLFWRLALAEQRAARFGRELVARGTPTDVALDLAAAVAP